jgi:hypothetical protein
LNYCDFFIVEPEIGKVYGIEAGKKLDQVLGVKKFGTFGLVALCRYSEGDYELVPTSVRPFSLFSPRF